VALLTPAFTLGAQLIPALPFVVPWSEVSLARIWGLGARRVGKFTVVLSILPQSSADDCLTAMDKLLFWLGLGAAQKGACGTLVLSSSILANAANNLKAHLRGQAVKSSVLKRSIVIAGHNTSALKASSGIASRTSPPSEA
jgi:hypothetical protein